MQQTLSFPRGPHNGRTEHSQETRSLKTRKLILTNFQVPGDILMLTAAVRNLHVTLPGHFLTDVRTPCMHLCESSPRITAFAEDDLDVETPSSKYPLIYFSNIPPRRRR